MVFTSCVHLAATIISTSTSIGNGVIRIELCTEDKELCTEDKEDDQHNTLPHF